MIVAVNANALPRGRKIHDGAAPIYEFQAL